MIAALTILLAANSLPPAEDGDWMFRSAACAAVQELSNAALNGAIAAKREADLSDEAAREVAERSAPGALGVDAIEAIALPRLKSMQVRDGAIARELNAIARRWAELAGACSKDYPVLPQTTGRP